MVGVTIETERVVLRPWRDEDRAPFAALNADPRVMEKIGLIERHEFDHPLLPDHPRQHHVLYSIRAEDR